MTQSPPPVLSTLSPERLRTVCTEGIHRPVLAGEVSVLVLVLSGSAERPPLLASVGVGGQIPKPFDIDPVVAAVGRLALGERA